MGQVEVALADGGADFWPIRSSRLCDQADHRLEIFMAAIPVRFEPHHSFSFTCPVGKFESAFKIELPEHIRNVKLHSIRAYVQTIRNLLVR